jgi:hypothetical protein
MKSSKAKTNVVPLKSGTVPSQQQLPLLPIMVDAEFPSTLKTADLKTLVRARDGHYYAVKSQKEHTALPASEYLCYRLASACQIAVPYAGVLAYPNGQFVFGSRFEGGTSEYARENSETQLKMFSESAAQVSTILAFDLFVGNDDRHRGNFLFRRTQEGRFAPLAIDFSRALFVKNFPNDPFPMSMSSNTRTTVNSLKKSDLWRGPQATFAIDSIRSVSADHIARWLEEMPAEWLANETKTNLISWWDSENRNKRLNELYEII